MPPSAPLPPPTEVPAKKSISPLAVGVLACTGLFGLVVLIGIIAAIASPSKPVASTTAPPVTSGDPNIPTVPPTTAAPTTAPTPTEPPTTAPPTTEAPKETSGQSNARRSAQQYLKTMPFSRAGLIKQLSSSYGAGFSLEDATYGADSLNANWNEQAVRSAKQYLSTMPFSRDALIKQLSSDYGAQFTYDEAVYGVNGAGL
jgi:hypothetical protein